jgi:hypothetical protein
MGLHEIKKFLHVKETFARMKRQTTAWEKNLANDLSDRELIHRINKELKLWNNERTNNLVNKWGN